MYVDDWEQDEAVQLMSNCQRGVYHRLLNHQWREGSIPDNITVLSVLAREPLGSFTESIWPVIAGKFEACGTGRLRNPRLQKEIEKADALSETRRNAGSLRQANAPQLQSKSGGQSQSQSQSQVTTKKKPNHLRFSDDRVFDVLTHYRDTHPRRRPFLPDGSPEQGASRVVARALEWGYSVADLNRAITANANDSWHRERKKHELGYVLRTSEKISEWIDRASNDEEEAGLYGGITWMAGGDAGGDSSPDSGSPEAGRVLGDGSGGCVEGGGDLGGAQRPGLHADDGGEVLEDVP